MPTRRGSVAAIATLVFGLCHADVAGAQALSGTVSSAAEGRMEGVLVSVKKDGSSKTITVVSDAQGTYRFPVGRLEAGTYAVSIRAVGYDLASPSTVAVTGTA